MTNEEILDQLQDLADCWIEGGDSTLARKYITELRSRLTVSPPATEVTITSRIKGSPEMIGMVVGKFISENTTPDDIAQLREQLLSRVVQPPA